MTGFFTAILLSSFILVHDWYDPWCCNEKDCKPVPCEELVKQPDGTIKYKEYTIPKDKILATQDKDCHVCIYQGNGRCAYIRLQGV